MPQEAAACKRRGNCANLSAITGEVHMRKTAVWMAVAVLAAGVARGETVRERLLKSYDAVHSLSCEIRRDMPLPDGQTVRMRLGLPIWISRSWMAPSMTS